MKKAILILLIGIFMNPTFHLYGMKITLAGDLTAARDRAHLARLLMFKTKLVNVNNLDIIQNNLRLNDGTHVHFMSQHGFDSATIYVPPKPGKGKPEYIEKPMFEVIPYIFASGEVFDSAGLLVCHGGYDFSGWYEVFSPYGEFAVFEYLMEYTPYQYKVVEGEYEFYNYGDERAGEDAEIIEWQVKEFYDYTRLVEREYESGSEWHPVFWDEVPWMTEWPRWDPVFYDTYDDFYQESYYGDGSSKTYYAYSTYSGVTRNGDRIPDFEVFYGTWELVVNNGTTLANCYTKQWYEGDWETGNETWHRTQTTGNIGSCAIDQANPEKFGVIWDLVDATASATHQEFMGNLWNMPTDNFVYSNRKLVFTGLGHEVVLPGLSSTRESIRLYNINGQYVCLFSYVAGRYETARVYIGSAVEGGEFNLVDLTDGIMINGELKHVLTRPDYPISFGILKRIEPTKRIKKEQ